MTERLPVFAVCGYSGAGKTTVVEAVARRLEARGLRTAVIKHDAHGPSVDTPGKDSDRFFQAGADVLLHGPGERFFRAHARGPAPDLDALVVGLCRDYDVVLVEGHKTTPLPHRIWLLAEGETAPPAEAGAVQAVLPRDADRVGAAMALIEAGLREAWRRTPVRAGVLVGGRSRRMGAAKHLLRTDGATWVERIVRALRAVTEEVTILGQGELPPALGGLARLPDVPGREGPIAGMLAALRWAPHSGWVFAACDMPMVTPAALEWLLAQRRPGCWAVLPVRAPGEPVEPLLAYYDFRAAGLLERCRQPSALAGQPQVISPCVPPELATAWTNLNAPLDVARAGMTEAG